MKIRGLLFLATLSLFGQVQAQELKTIVDKKGKVGYADLSGNEVIKCQYDGAFPFNNGMAIVTKAGKSGMIDKSGKVVLPLKYSQITLWTKNLYLIKSGKVMGLADLAGNVVLPAKYTFVSQVNSYGKALIAIGGKVTTNEKKQKYLLNAKYGIIDEKGNVLVTPKYKGFYEFAYDGAKAYPYHEGKRLIYSYHAFNDTLVTDCEYLGFSKNPSSIVGAGIMDGHGNELMKMGLYDQVMLPKGNMVRYYIVKKKETLCGYHNIETSKGFQVAKFDKPMADMNYWSHGDFIGNLAPVNGDSWSFIDKNGQAVRKGYSALKHSEHLELWAAVSGSGKWDVFNEQNENMEILSGYEDVIFPAFKDDKEIFVVKKDGKYGAITKTGDTVIPFEYENASGNWHDYVAVQNSGKWGVIAASNDDVIEKEYLTVMLPSERGGKDFWVMKSDSLYYHYDTSKGTISESGFKAVTNFVNGVAHVAPASMVIADNIVNKAQLFAPNAPNGEISKADLSKYQNSFGYLYGASDIMLFDAPVSTLYIDDVKKMVAEQGNRPMTDSEKKRILLDVTKYNRSYEMKSKVSEEDWDY